ncbi:hypothetical protein JCM16161A_10910 [Vulcanisaeta sp. JCM 16161]|uniref:hypothetical protein n=1 Tax=Vulcanisaeta sp. JCM 16161 TaxID=1295372 RepID=UPI000A7066E8
MLKDWYSYLKELKSVYGDKFKIYACPLAAQLYNIKKEDLVDIVDDINSAYSRMTSILGTRPSMTSFVNFLIPSLKMLISIIIS